MCSYQIGPTEFTETPHSSYPTNAAGHYYIFDQIRSGSECDLQAYCYGYEVEHSPAVLLNANKQVNFSMTAEAPEYSFSGVVEYVSAQGTDVKIEGAKAVMTHLSDSSYLKNTLYTDENGLFKFTSIPAGNVSLTVSKDGYSDYTKRYYMRFDVLREGIKLTSLSDYYYLRGKCYEGNSSGFKRLVNCKASFLSEGRLVSVKDAVSVVFEDKLPKGYYTVKATYNGMSSSHPEIIDLSRDISPSEITITFSTTDQEIQEGFAGFWVGLASLSAVLGTLGLLIVFLFAIKVLYAVLP